MSVDLSKNLGKIYSYGESWQLPLHGYKGPYKMPVITDRNRLILFDLRDLCTCIAYILFYQNPDLVYFGK